MEIAPNLFEKSLDSVSDTLIDKYNEESSLRTLEEQVRDQNAQGKYVWISSVEVEKVSRFEGDIGNGIIVLGKIYCDIGGDEDDEYISEKIYSFREIIFPNVGGKIKIGKINLAKRNNDL